MSLRFRRTLKIMPGVRLNFNKDSIGVSLGVRGAHYTMNSKGRRTISAGIPGSGLSSVETLSSGRSRSRREASDEVSSEVSSGPPSPGLFASKKEKDLNAFLLDIYDADSKDTPIQVVEKATALKTKHPALAPAADLVTFLHGVTDDKSKIDAPALGNNLWSNRASVFTDPLVSKYFKGITPSAQITRGISSNEIYNAQTLGFIYAEVLQSNEKYDEALAVLDQMIPDQLVAISIADIELMTKKYDEAIETTEDIENEDDATAMLLILRGIAFREKTLNDAAVECFKRALSRKDRSEGLLHRALFERAETYIRLGKKAMAIKDLEKILVDEPQYPEVEEKLASIKK
jgi:tetratricopeptide (TPR) repeat protein